LTDIAVPLFSIGSAPELLLNNQVNVEGFKAFNNFSICEDEMRLIAKILIIISLALIPCEIVIKDLKENGALEYTIVVAATASEAAPL
jgi:hypothetical protein